MVCPHCKYESKWEKDGEHGGFYELPVKLEREGEGYYGPDRKALYACPSCGKTFIDV